MGSYIDINTVDLKECSDNEFIIDTNALLWAFYPNSQSNSSVAARYSNFISQLITNDRRIYIPMFNFCEAINVIEKIEYRIYRESSGNKNLKLKDYRAIANERENLKCILDLFIEQIENIPQIKLLSQELGYKIPKMFVDDFNKHRLDLFDVFLIEISKDKGYSIITDDKDFLSINCNSNIYTCNQNILIGI